MGIELGEEYITAAKENIEKGALASRSQARELFGITAAILAIWIGAAHYFSLPDGLIISVTIAVATMCLIWVLNSRTIALEADIIYDSGAIEWFGQKSLESSFKARNR